MTKRELMKVCRQCANEKWALMVEKTAAQEYVTGDQEPACKMCFAVGDNCAECPLNYNAYCPDGLYGRWWITMENHWFHEATAAALTLQMILLMLADGEGVWPKATP